MAVIINFFGGPGLGKCFGKNTPILMHDGSIKMCQDINVGEFLMGRDGTPRKVLRLFNGFDELYKVIPRKGDSFIVTGDHKLVLDFKHHSRKSEKCLSVREILNSNKTLQTRSKLIKAKLIEFNSKEVDIEPYFLGLWLGDGHSNSQRVSNVDLEVINYLQTLSNKYNMSLNNHNKNGACGAYSITSGVRGYHAKNKLLESLKNYNLINNKHIPNDYLFNTSEIRLQLLAGLIDSDGYVIDKCASITMKNRDLINQVLFLCRSLGFSANMSEKIKTCCNTGKVGTYWQVNISGNLSIIPTIISRKKIGPRKQIKDVLVTGFKIEPCGLGEYFGFEIDGDKIHLLGDFTLTHNSSFSLGLSYRLKRIGKRVEYVSEYAKGKTWIGDFNTLKHQKYVTAKQIYYIDRAKDQVDAIITDSPILTGFLYQGGVRDHEWERTILNHFNKDHNINILLVRNNENHEYDEVGRNQSKEEAEQLDKEMKNFLISYNIPYWEFDISSVNCDDWKDETLDQICDLVLERIYGSK